MSNSPSSARVITLGCRLNTYESEVIRRHADAAGLNEAIIVNTCAVTGEAVRQARQTIRRAARDNPDCPVIVTGCAAQIDPEMFAAMPEVKRIIGNDAKMRAETWEPRFLFDEPERVRVDDIMSVTETAPHLIEGMEGRARAYVQVQNGCDHRCTFCVIPYGRGNSRSVPAGDVVRQVQTLVDAGHYEVVLTGVDLTSWGGDLPGTPALGNLIQRVLKLVPGLKQLRLSSIDAIEIDDTLFEAITEDHRIAPYLHLSLQHGDDLILKRMKRRHSAAEAIALTQRLRAARPEITFGADLIAGFPTETDAAFENSLALIERCGIAFLHAFPYSPRPGTPAAKMPQVPAKTIKERAGLLREAGVRALGRHLETHIGTIREALVETETRARLADFTPLEIIDAPPSISGRVIRTQILKHDGAKLIGAPV